MIREPMKASFTEFDTFAQKFSSAAKKLDSNFKKCLDILADKGWYVSMDMSLGDIFTNAANAMLNKDSNVDITLTKYYKTNRKSFVLKLSNFYPDRADLLSQALYCHNKKQYAASTLLFLSQADGIFEGNLFKISKDKARLKKQLADAQSSHYLIEVITKIRGIDSFTGNKTNYKSDLNRHECMHGLNTTYGTEMNSLKALSLLCFISDLTNRPKMHSA